MIIQQRHFPVCPSVSRETFCQYQRLKGLTARSASTKEYWVSAARKLGLVDTSKGVFFKQSNHVDETIVAPQAGSPQDASTLAAAEQQIAPPLVRLVEPSDKIFATEYSYFVMEQMTTCVFTEADRLGKRKCHTVGFAGMACKHCVGGNGSGRFFPLTLKTFSDVSKSIHVLRNHLIKCTKAPGDMAETVTTLYKQHKNEKVRLYMVDSSRFVVYSYVILTHPILLLINSKPRHLDLKRSSLIVSGSGYILNLWARRKRLETRRPRSRRNPSLAVVQHLNVPNSQVTKIIL